MSHVSLVVRSCVGKKVTVSDRASSLVTVVDVVGGDVTAWGYVTEGMGVRACTVDVVAATTIHAEFGGRRKMICGVPVVPIPRALFLVFASQIVHFNGFSHGEELRAIRWWGWNRFCLSEIGVDTGSDFGANETVANGKRSAAPFSKFSLQFSFGL